MAPVGTPVGTPVALPSPQAFPKLNGEQGTSEKKGVDINSSNSLICHEENTKEINV